MSATTVSRLIPLLALAALLAGCQGAERPLAPSLGGPQFSQSPGHNLKGKIAFHSNRDGDFEIFVMNADGTGQTQLTHNDSHEFDPMWSPDGKQIGFSSFGDGDAEIFVMNADGTGTTQLTDNAFDDFGPIWSPDGKQIAFKSNRDGADDIYAMNPDGSGVTRLTTNSYVVGVTAWSPNGKQIAFISYRDCVVGDNCDLEIFVMNADGTGEIQLTNNNVNDEGDHAGWSPNGKLFSFSSRRDGGDLDIFVMNADGTGVTQLTHNDFVEDDDSFWSPDGQHIAFHSTRDGDEEVYVMNADGSGVIQLTDNTGFADGVPAWIAGSVRAKAASSDVQRINEHYQITSYQTNPCNGEQIVLDGRYHVNGTITTTSNGTDFRLHLNTEHFQGVGLTTGLKYLYHEQTRQQEVFTYNPFTDKFEYAVSYAVISQGSTDNFHADVAYTYSDPPFDFQIIRNDARCTG